MPCPGQPPEDLTGRSLDLLDPALLPAELTEQARAALADRSRP
jgi:hypothetical protein